MKKLFLSFIVFGLCCFSISAQTDTIHIDIDKLLKRDKSIKPFLDSLKLSNKATKNHIIITGKSYSMLWVTVENSKSDLAYAKPFTLDLSKLIPDSDGSILNTFSENQLLLGITLPDKPHIIIPGFFQNCTNLQYVHNTAAIKKIPNAAFYNCKNLSDIELSDSIREIGTSAFAYCKKLKLKRLPKQLEILGTSAFAYCTSISGHIKFPKSLRQIRNSPPIVSGAPFENNYKVTKFSLDSENKHFKMDDKDVLYSANMDTLIMVPHYYKGVYKAPNTVKRIAPGAVSYVPGLTKFIFPDSLKLLRLAYINILHFGTYPYILNCENLSYIDYNNVNGMTDSFESRMLSHNIFFKRVFANCPQLDTIRITQPMGTVEYRELLKDPNIPINYNYFPHASFFHNSYEGRYIHGSETPGWRYAHFYKYNKEEPNLTVPKNKKKAVLVVPKNRLETILTTKYKELNKPKFKVILHQDSSLYAQLFRQIITDEEATSGIRDQSLSIHKRLHLHPNPARERVTINFEGEEATLQLYRSDGSIAIEQVIVPGQKLHIETLNKGIYILKVINREGNVSIGKLIKQ